MCNGIKYIIWCNTCKDKGYVTLAKIKGMFNKDKLITSFVKYISLIIGVFFLYIAGMLNENVIVAQIDGISVNLVSGIKLLFTLGLMYYGGQSLIKLKDLLGIKIGLISIDKEK